MTRLAELMASVQRGLAPTGSSATHNLDTLLTHTRRARVTPRKSLRDGPQNP
jgi:hypothetical protein